MENEPTYQQAVMETQRQEREAIAAGTKTDHFPSTIVLVEDLSVQLKMLVNAKEESYPVYELRRYDRFFLEGVIPLVEGTPLVITVTKTPGKILFEAMPA